MQAYLHTFPELAGTPFGQLQFYFPDATIYGVIRKQPRRCILNPSHSLPLAADDEIITIRPTALSRADFQPLREPVAVSLGTLPKSRMDAGCASYWRLARFRAVKLVRMHECSRSDVASRRDLCRLSFMQWP